MTGDRPTTPGWHCHRCRSTSCRQRADSDTDHVGRVEYRPLLLTQPSSVSWLWSHTHWCPSQRPQEVMRVDGSANPTMPKNPAQYTPPTPPPWTRPPSVQSSRPLKYISLYDPKTRDPGCPFEATRRCYSRVPNGVGEERITGRRIRRKSCVFSLACQSFR